MRRHDIYKHLPHLAHEVDRLVDRQDEIALSEGDLVLTFNKTIDLMRQVREMIANVAPDHPLRETLTIAERFVRRDIVEQSLALGFLPIASEESAPAPDDTADALDDE